MAIISRGDAHLEAGWHALQLIQGRVKCLQEVSIWECFNCLILESLPFLLIETLSFFAGCKFDIGIKTR